MIDIEKIVPVIKSTMDLAKRANKLDGAGRYGWIAVCFSRLEEELSIYAGDGFSTVEFKEKVELADGDAIDDFEVSVDPNILLQFLSTDSAQRVHFRSDKRGNLLVTTERSRMLLKSLGLPEVRRVVIDGPETLVLSSDAEMMMGVIKPAYYASMGSGSPSFDGITIETDLGRDSVTVSGINGRCAYIGALEASQGSPRQPFTIFLYRERANDVKSFLGALKGMVQLWHCEKRGLLIIRHGTCQMTTPVELRPQSVRSMFDRILPRNHEHDGVRMERADLVGLMRSCSSVIGDKDRGDVTIRPSKDGHGITMSADGAGGSVARSIPCEGEPDFLKILLGANVALDSLRSISTKTVRFSVPPSQDKVIITARAGLDILVISGMEPR